VKGAAERAAAAAEVLRLEARCMKGHTKLGKIRARRREQSEAEAAQTAEANVRRAALDADTQVSATRVLQLGGGNWTSVFDRKLIGC
jgi:hypothetical protein